MATPRSQRATRRQVAMATTPNSKTRHSASRTTPVRSISTGQSQAHGSKPSHAATQKVLASPVRRMNGVSKTDKRGSGRTRESFPEYQSSGQGRATRASLAAADAEKRDELLSPRLMDMSSPRPTVSRSSPPLSARRVLATRSQTPKHQLPNSNLASSTNGLNDANREVQLTAGNSSPRQDKLQSFADRSPRSTTASANGRGSGQSVRTPSRGTLADCPGSATRTNMGGIARARPLNPSEGLLIVSEEHMPELLPKLADVPPAEIMGFDNPQDNTNDPVRIHDRDRGAVHTGHFNVIHPVEIDGQWELPRHHILGLERMDQDDGIEYDMDSGDEAWLQAYNDAREGAELSCNAYEVIIDRLEKEFVLQTSHSRMDKRGIVGLTKGGGHKLCEDDCACAVCGYDLPHDDNEIVLCDGCNVAVHQLCYGIPSIPSGEWRCDVCKAGLLKEPECVLCHGTGGAMKPTDDGRWAHLMCSIWTEQTQVLDAVCMSPIAGVRSVPPEIQTRICCFCNKPGASVSCGRAGCHSTFHATCGRHQGCYLRLEEENAGEGVLATAYCPQHRPASSIGLVDEAIPKNRDGEPYSSLFSAVPLSRVVQAFDISADHLAAVYYRWADMRASKQGALLTRFMAFPEGYFQDEPGGVRRRTNDANLLKNARKLRFLLDQIRLIADLIGRRERMKLRMLKTDEEIRDLESKIGHKKELVRIRAQVEKRVQKIFAKDNLIRRAEQVWEDESSSDSELDQQSQTSEEDEQEGTGTPNFSRKRSRTESTTPNGRGRGRPRKESVKRARQDDETNADSLEFGTVSNVVSLPPNLDFLDRLEQHLKQSYDLRFSRARSIHLHHLKGFRKGLKGTHKVREWEVLVNESLKLDIAELKSKSTGPFLLVKDGKVLADMFSCLRNQTGFSAGSSDNEAALKQVQESPEESPTQLTNGSRMVIDSTSSSVEVVSSGESFTVLSDEESAGSYSFSGSESPMPRKGRQGTRGSLHRMTKASVPSPKMTRSNLLSRFNGKQTAEANIHGHDQGRPGRFGASDLASRDGMYVMLSDGVELNVSPQKRSAVSRRNGLRGVTSPGSDRALRSRK